MIMAPSLYPVWDLASLNGSKTLSNTTTNYKNKQERIPPTIHFHLMASFFREYGWVIEWLHFNCFFIQQTLLFFFNKNENKKKRKSVKSAIKKKTISRRQQTLIKKLNDQPTDRPYGAKWWETGLDTQITYYDSVMNGLDWKLQQQKSHNNCWGNKIY